MAFIDAQFPVTISYGSRGGPKYKTSIIVMRSGQEKGNIDWEYPQHEYDAAIGVRRMTELEDLIAFFHVVQGRGHSFRWKDWADYKSCRVSQAVSALDQSIGTGNGSTAAFQLTKIYLFGGYQKVRKITKPVAGTVLVALDGASTTAFSVNTSTGILTFNTPPGNGVAITAGYEFDVHCRLDTDELSTSLEDYQAGATEVPVIEIKGAA